MSERITIEVSGSIVRAAQDFAAREGVSLDTFVARAIAERLARRNAGDVFGEIGRDGDAERAARWLEERPEAG